MKIICAGMSKCGTKSMHVALEELGYMVHDFPDAYTHFEKHYRKCATEGWNSEDFHHMYKDIDAVVDAPTYYFWDELMEAFPDAKIILMKRDDDEIWYKSIRKQILSFNGLHSYYYQFLSSTWRKFFNFATHPCKLAFGCKTPTIFDIIHVAPPTLPYKLAYRKHIAYVLHKCPKDRLLIYNCKNGWRPLCEFLGKPMPTKIFPFINRNGELSDMMWNMPIIKKARREMLTTAATLLVTSMFFGVYLFKFR
ncbi:uncharacterized protein LOC120333049 [Styela clava]